MVQTQGFSNRQRLYRRQIRRAMEQRASNLNLHHSSYWTSISQPIIFLSFFPALKTFNCICHCSLLKFLSLSSHSHSLTRYIYNYRVSVDVAATKSSRDSCGSLQNNNYFSLISVCALCAAYVSAEQDDRPTSEFVYTHEGENRGNM